MKEKRISTECEIFKFYNLVREIVSLLIKSIIWMRPSSRFYMQLSIFISDNFLPIVKNAINYWIIRNEYVYRVNMHLSTLEFWWSYFLLNKLVD